MRISPDSPAWVAPRGPVPRGDARIEAAIAWLEGLADPRDWAARQAAVRITFDAAKQRWAAGERVALYDPTDAACWYIFQARAYGGDFQDWVPQEAARILPLLARIGDECALLASIPGAEDRARRLMNAGRAQPDAGLFELLVALAYRRNGWDTAFVPELRGRARTPDLLVAKGRRKWAVECKRMDGSAYHIQEAARVEALAQSVHDFVRSRDRSIVMTVAFATEVDRLPDDYLLSRAEAFLADPDDDRWMDAGGAGIVEEVDWRLARLVLDVDDVYFGSSRMIELLLGGYDHDLAHSMDGRWDPAPNRPFWASALHQASVVSWRNRSQDATRKKARHFRRVAADAARQLPKDRPGVVHVGVESWSGGSVDAARHVMNRYEMRHFDPKDTRLRWVYGEYFIPEVTTREDEGWAMVETSASYRVGRHGTAEPLPYHMLVTPEEGTMHGVHWDEESQYPLVRD